jgi:PAS domain S-box-containing protein
MLFIPGNTTAIVQWSTTPFIAVATEIHLINAVPSSLEVVLLILAGLGVVLLFLIYNWIQCAIAKSQETEKALRQAYTDLEKRAAELTETNQELQNALTQLQITEEYLWQQNKELKLTRSLAESQRQRYQDLFNFAPDGYLVTDALGIIQEANQAATQLLAIELNALVGKLFSDFVNQTEYQTIYNQLNQFPLHSYKVYSWEIHLQPHNTNSFPVEITVAPILIQDLLLGWRWLIRDISQRKQAEEALQQSEELHRITLSSISDAVFITNNEGSFTYVCPNGHVIFGYNSEELKELNNINCLLGENLFEETQLNDYGEIQNIEWEITDKFSRKHNLLINVKRVDIQGGTILYSCRDITERKQAEAALQQREKQLRRMAANIPGSVYRAVFSGDRKMSLSYISDGVRELTEIGSDEIMAHPERLIEFLHPDDRKQFYECQNNAMTTLQHYQHEYRVITASGKLKWARNIGRFSRDENGNLVVDGVALDITDRKRTELALQEERNFISTIFQTVGALILVTDLEGRIIRFNRAFEQVTGYSFEEVKGQPFCNLFLLPEEVESVQAIFQELCSGQFPNQHENYLVTRDGTRKLISWSNTVLVNANDEIKYLIGSGIDITERKRAEEIRRALEREKELRQLQLRFFSMVSHEFRTPISSILLSAQSLELFYAGWTQEKIFKNLKRIQNSAKSMTQLLADILTINRAESGQLEFNPQLFNLEEFCHNLVEQLRLIHRDDVNLRLNWQIPNQEAYLDKNLLTSVLNNLLNNAIKFSHPGSLIEFTVRIDSQQIIFQICDRGIGIPPEDIPYLFEPFHRGRNVDNIPGTGLGITVVKKCLDVQNGKISIDSQVGLGTTVTVTFPQSSSQQIAR